MLAWRGFTEEPAALPGAAARARPAWSPAPARCCAGGARRAPLVVAGPGRASPAWRASADLSGSPAAGRARLGPRCARPSGRPGRAPTRFAAPGARPRRPASTPTSIAGGLGCLLLVDLLACTLRRAPLAGLPLLSVYSVPVGMLGISPGVVGLRPHRRSATCAALPRAGRAGRAAGAARLQPGRRRRASGIASPARSGCTPGRSAAASPRPAVAACRWLIPDPQRAAARPRSRHAAATPTSRSSTPPPTCAATCAAAADLPLVGVRTDDPDPSYLRIATLNRFSDNEWSSGDRDIPSDQVADGPLPPLQGVARPCRARRTPTTLDATDGLRLHLAAHAAPPTDIEAARRLALRHLHHGLHRQRRRPRHRRPDWSCDADRARPRRHRPGRAPGPHAARSAAPSSTCPTGIQPLRASTSPRRSPRDRASPLREGGGAAELVPRERRLHLQPRRSTSGPPATTWSRSSAPRTAAASATASSSPRRWR